MSIYPHIYPYMPTISYHIFLYRPIGLYILIYPNISYIVLYKQLKHRLTARSDTYQFNKFKSMRVPWSTCGPSPCISLAFS